VALSIRRLSRDDAEAYAALRHEMLVAEPFAFLASPGDDVASSVERARTLFAPEADGVVIGAFDGEPDGGLVGSVGLYRERHRKASHKINVWGMYVRPDARRRGIGRRLVEAAVTHARGVPGITQVHLSVSSRANVARALYESVGFRAWGTEPRAIGHDGEFVDEHHMVLPLDG